MDSCFSTKLMLALLLVVSSCSVFELPEDKTTVPGKYFLEEDAMDELHFRDSCFFSDYYPDFIRSDYSDWVELSCLITQEDERPWGHYCVFMGIPKKACKIENNRLSFSSRCSVTIHFATLYYSVFHDNSVHNAKAHFRGSAQLTGDTASGPIRVDLRMDDGDRVSLVFNHVTMSSVLLRINKRR